MTCGHACSLPEGCIIIGQTLCQGCVWKFDWSSQNTGGHQQVILHFTHVKANIGKSPLINRNVYRSTKILMLTSYFSPPWVTQSKKSDDTHGFLLGLFFSECSIINKDKAFLEFWLLFVTNPSNSTLFLFLCYSFLFLCHVIVTTVFKNTFLSCFRECISG